MEQSNISQFPRHLSDCILESFDARGNLRGLPLCGASMPSGMADIGLQGANCLRSGH